jgi:hypothetical protein
MGKRKRIGLSKFVKIAYGEPLGSDMRVRSVRLNNSDAEAQVQRRRLREQIAGADLLPLPFPRFMQDFAGMSFEEREIILEDRGPNNDSDLLNAIPPGEEAMFLSHAGGVDEVHHDVLNQILPER